jgi:hypothetical protein
LFPAYITKARASHGEICSVGSTVISTVIDLRKKI